MLRIVYIRYTPHKQDKKNKKLDKIMSKKEKETPILADEALGKSEAFVLNNKKTITGVVLAVVLLVVAYLGYTKFILEPQNNEANKAMVVAVQNFEAGNHAESLDGDGINMGTRAIADEYGNTSRPGIFGSGDVVHGARTVVEAVAHSKIVAETMHQYMQSLKD